MVGPTRIPKGDAFELVCNDRRQAVLRYLQDHSYRDQFAIQELADEIAAWEHETTVQDLSPDERKRVYISLFQSHLPKLDEYDVIEYNTEQGTIEPTPLLAAFEPLLGESLHDDDGYFTATTDATERSGLTRAVTSLFTK